MIRGPLNMISPMPLPPFAGSLPMQSLILTNDVVYITTGDFVYPNSATTSIPNQQYIVNTGTLVVPYTITDTMKCGFATVFTSTLYGGAELPGFIKYQHETSTYSITSTNNSAAGTYTIVMIETLVADREVYDDSVQWTLTVIGNTYDVTLPVPPYYITDP